MPASTKKLEQQRETRRQKVLALLEERPQTPRAVHIDDTSDPDYVILCIGIRHIATGELQVPRAKYDPWIILELMDKMGG